MVDDEKYNQMEKVQLCKQRGLSRVFVVANLMMRLMTCPGLTPTSPARRNSMANLNVGLEQGIGSNRRLKQRLTRGKPCKKESD